ncbi:MAG TPA: Uma2 family endonuclease [Polyangiaceae bacterium]
MVTQEVPRIRPLLRTEYDKLAALGAFEDERLELLEGALVEMSPIGPPHSSTVDKLTMLFAPALVGRAIVRVQGPFAAENISEPEPDLMVMPLGDYTSGHPEQALLVIEVSESSLRKDRGIKQRIYARNGARDYWIVNLVERVVEVYREPQAERYTLVQRFAPGDSVTPLAFPDLAVPVNAVL